MANNDIKFQFELITLADDLGEITQTELARHKKRKSLRIDVENAEPPVHIGGFGAMKESFKVKTLSETGAAFYHNDQGVKSKIGHYSKTVLDVGEFQVPMMGRVLYANQDSMGLEFVQPNVASSTSLRSHFKLEFIAASLRASFLSEVNPEGVAQKKVCYGNHEGYRVEIISEGNELKSFEIDCGQGGFAAKWEHSHPLYVFSEVKQKPTEKIARNQVISFLRNLEAMNPRLLLQMSTIAKSVPIQIDCLR